LKNKKKKKREKKVLESVIFARHLEEKKDSNTHTLTF